MPTTRRRIGRRQIRGELPVGAAWWLQHGRSLGIREAIALGMTQWDAWQAYLLHFDHQPAARSTFWSREDLRELGYGAAIDAHVQAGRARADGWRTPQTATVLPFRGNC
jgi:hypothetical protein